MTKSQSVLEIFSFLRKDYLSNVEAQNAQDTKQNQKLHVSWKKESKLPTMKGFFLVEKKKI